MCRVDWIAGVLLATILGCGDLSSPPDSFVLPPENLSLDTAALRIGHVLYACHRWSSDFRPKEGPVVADLHFGRRGPDDPMDRPREESLDSVRARGGEILLVFAFPAARVRMTPAALATMVDDHLADHVRSVPDLARYDWNVTVFLRQQVSAQDWLTSFPALGGRVTHWYFGLNMFSGDLPNRSIPLLRGRPEVESVGADGLACLWPGLPDRISLPRDASK
jgi:hypothetical protein